jgi:hypothetical protein
MRNLVLSLGSRRIPSLSVPFSIATLDDKMRGNSLVGVQNGAAPSVGTE